MKSKILNTLTIPLLGHRLIEASAGTGKTYTIANLYLRLILGYNPTSNNQHHSALIVEQILILTFTEAATNELRDRIRKKIHQAKIDFDQGKSDDPFIQQLIEQCNNVKTNIDRLMLAEQQMDEAAIYTIHGFSHRILQQYAFESHSLLQQELLTNQNDLLENISMDFWRNHCYGMEDSLASLAYANWKTPKILLNDIKNWLSKPILAIKFPSQAPENIIQLKQKFIEPIKKIKKIWKEQQFNLTEMINNAALKKNSKAVRNLNKMHQFMHSDHIDPSSYDKKLCWSNYQNEYLTKNTKKGYDVISHLVFDLISQIDLQLTSKIAVYYMILKQAIETIKTQSQIQKKRDALLSFDDLLLNLHQALEKEDTGSQLAQIICQKHPVAMVDEFQDTDEIQYKIISNIYKEKENIGLLMIGDPKQAIYAFRGADIFTYMKARSQVQSCYHLNINWRSAPTMVEGVNSLFQAHNNPFIFDDIPFKAVQSAPKNTQHRVIMNDEPMKAITLWFENNNPMTKKDYQTVMASSTAKQVNHLLSLAKNNQCYLESKEGKKTLEAKDIAILVRSNLEAQAIRTVLNKQNIASVYLSNKESVLNSVIALDILYIMNACISPHRISYLITALASPIFGLSAKQLQDIQTDEIILEQFIQEFREYYAIWQKQGILPMLKKLLYQRKIGQILLADLEGERKLTDFLHLAELLQNKSQTLKVPQTLIRWFKEECLHANHPEDEHQLHLESEYNLVKIITIHKSKGLEYNICFIPFICSYQESKQPFFHDPTQEYLPTLDYKNQQAYTLAEKERLAEDLRILYVAMTRSVYSCFLGLANIKKNKNPIMNAIDYLFNNIHDDLYNRVIQWANQNSAINVIPPFTETISPFIHYKNEHTELSAKTLDRTLENSWRITSYSAITKPHHTSSSLMLMDEYNHQLDFEISTPNDIEKTEQPLSIFNFPKGAAAGTFLHTLFEQLPNENTHDKTMREFIHQQLSHSIFNEHWQDVLFNFLHQCLDTKLLTEGLTLKKLQPNQKIIEMEFFIPIHSLSCTKYNKIVKKYDLISHEAGDIEFQILKGMLKGFIDLTFEYNGKWYVLDYKSNFLGNSIEDYHQAAMKKAMIEHRYDIQYQLYSLALYRLLKIRLKNFDYKKHFGGVIYLFLRGVQLNSQHGVLTIYPDQALVESLDKLFSGNKV